MKRSRLSPAGWWTYADLLDFLLFLTTAWAAAASGRTILGALGFKLEMPRLERTLIGFALGLGLLSALMLALGLAGGLYRPLGFVPLAVLLALGAKQHGPMVSELRSWFGTVRLTGWGWALTFAFTAFGLISFIGCYAPPTTHLEWDSVAYHLADPKMYLQAHRIYYIPWEDHSNFAFTAEMWYLYGLLLSSFPLAKLFHFACGAGTCLAIYTLGIRQISPTVGKIAALLFASLPLVFWEAGTAYVDLATAFFTTLTLLALGAGITRRDDRWLRLSAILMGLTLTTKATALATLALLALGLLLWRLRGLKETSAAAFKSTVLWGITALVVGSPWLIKSAILTGNPVYPFFYGLFGGRYWDKSAADAYTSWNAVFGMGHSLSDIALVPWNLIMFLLPGHVTAFPKPFNDYQTEYGALSPILLAALFFPAFLRGASGPVKAFAAFALCSLLLWAGTMQYIRYLLPTLPVLCLLSAYILTQACTQRLKSGYALAGLGVLSLAFSLYIGSGLLLQETPVVFGQVSQDDYIAHGFGPYPAMQFINTQLPKNVKIVMYGNPLGLYCNRPYLWGDAVHGTYIPYDTFHSADDLRTYLHKLGVTHILVYQGGFPLTPPKSGPQSYPDWVYQLTTGTGPPLFSEHGTDIWAVP
ncbi:MAG: ArnT family glycosyltransferase [Janthinobacterium lividum]